MLLFAVVQCCVGWAIIIREVWLDGFCPLCVSVCILLCSVGIRTVDIFVSLFYKPIGASPLWIFNAINDDVVSTLDFLWEGVMLCV
jgi:hypothetical protein